MFVKVTVNGQVNQYHANVTQKDKKMYVNDQFIQIQLPTWMQTQFEGINGRNNSTHKYVVFLYLCVKSTRDSRRL